MHQQLLVTHSEGAIYQCGLLEKVHTDLVGENTAVWHLLSDSYIIITVIEHLLLWVTLPILSVVNSSGIMFAIQ